MKWHSQVGSVGGYWETGNDPADAIRFVDTDPGFRGRYADPVSRKP